jgi:small subunit ribosomal protein S8
MMTDPIADMLTRIRNANRELHATVTVPSSRLKEEIAKVLAAEGYLEGYQVKASGVKRDLELRLRYLPDRSRVINGLSRASRPGRRMYRAADELPRVRGGLGVAVVSTSQGLLTDSEARRRRLGGEIMCEVW